MSLWPNFPYTDYWKTKLDWVIKLLLQLERKVDAVVNPATTESLGVVQIGDGINVDDDGVISVPPGGYTLPPATANTLGGVKVGANLSVAADGTLSANSSAYSLPPATANTLGGIKVGSRLTVQSDGTLSADEQSFTLPTASTSTKGGIIVGDGLEIDENGVLSSDAGAYELPVASASTLGGVKVGSGLAIDENGELSADGSSYELPTASANTLGGVKIGSGLAIDGNGVLSASGSQYVLPEATANTLGGIKVGDRLSIQADGTLSAADQSYTLPAAASNVLGGVKVGSGLNIDANGVLSAAGYNLPIAGASTLGGVKIGQNLSIDADGTLNATGGQQYVLPVASDQTLGGVKVGDRLSIDANGVLSADPDYKSIMSDTVNVYMDYVDGNDTNDGLTSATAKRTFAAIHNAFKDKYTNIKVFVVEHENDQIDFTNCNIMKNRYTITHYWNGTSTLVKHHLKIIMPGITIGKNCSVDFDFDRTGAAPIQQVTDKLLDINNIDVYGKLRIVGGNELYSTKNLIVNMRIHGEFIANNLSTEVGGDQAQWTNANICVFPGAKIALSFTQFNWTGRADTYSEHGIFDFFDIRALPNPDYQPRNPVPIVDLYSVTSNASNNNWSLFRGLMKYTGLSTDIQLVNNKNKNGVAYSNA